MQAAKGCAEGGSALPKSATHSLSERLGAPS